ncbi:MAG: ABC transporter substrate-binding protein, partial [Hymenobacteraceae bacterium]|nr:ABC transporter substrate-binding protein [Hymenobacteraceae bacterium]MDX5395652.1 ABC transporter substrate-binding protein [Hymenobacteraceae bacterium]MDX5443447.1 ABC transporter substrate-binding protein [Hymenobacteraceae bacterium]MDX5511706.1 ABC transporter substrate-binding protein [Hymenobacteraceae bacterium]
SRKIIQKRSTYLSFHLSRHADMWLYISKNPYRFLAISGIALAVLVLIGVGTRRYFKQQQREYYQVGVIINSVEITAQDLAVVKFIINKKLHELNQAGGINGNFIKAIYLDDEGSPDKLLKLVKQTAANPNMVAYVGCRSSTRAMAIAPFLGEQQIPFIGSFSLTEVNAPYPNIYSMDVSMKEVSVVLQNLLLQKATRAAYIGKAGDIYSEALLQEMLKVEKDSTDFRVVLQQHIASDQAYSDSVLTALVSQLIQTKADFLLLSTEQGATNTILEKLWQQQVQIPVFTGLSDMSQVNQNLSNYPNGELYDVGVLGIPGAMNAKLQERLDLYKKELKPDGNLAFQVGYGGRLSDAIGMIWEAAKTANDELPVRQQINSGLKPYINGNRIYRGWFANCFFTSYRTFAGEELLAWKPPQSTSFMLAPFQFLRQNETLLPAPVIYTSLDLVELTLESDEDGYFDASFFLELTSENNLSISQLDFENAARNELNHQPLVETKLIRQSSSFQERPLHNYLYKVSGKFRFDPDLEPYPFDEQKFPFTIQTGSSDQNFLVQPPEAHLRDISFDSPGWTYLNNYVGYEQDIITTDTSFSSLKKNIPLYKFSFVYVLKRARIDFTLKTLVPLLAILIITYFSVFIPAREFEAMAAVQVTALLSAIALYFATPKPQMPYATVSDKIFIFSYLMITSLIGTSILIYVMYRRSSTMKGLARIYQRLVFPVILIGFTIFIRS